MYKNYRVVCIIPARGGSKSLPGKNILEVCGKPLIAHSIEQARNSGYIDRIIVSTDDKRIAEIAGHFDAEVPFIRPAKLAQDNSPTVKVLLHAVNWLENKEYDFDIVVLLHATAPLRAAEDIDNCIMMLAKEGADNIFSVTPSRRNPYYSMVEEVDGKIVPVKGKACFSARQEVPTVYDLNGSIYVWWKHVIKDKPHVYLENSKIYIMPPERSVDIDDELDFKLAKLLMEENYAGMQPEK